MTEHHHHDHEHEKNEHPFGWPYWHFIDIATDSAKAGLKPLVPLLEKAATHSSIAAKALPALTLTTSRLLPGIGVAGEAIHAWIPFTHAREDWEHGKLSNAEFAGLCAMYSAYAASGALGPVSAVAKEVITYQVQEHHLLNERYVPHTLYLELQHSGTLDWMKDKLDASGIPAKVKQAVDHAGIPHMHLQGTACSLCANALAALTPHANAPEYKKR